MYVVGVGLVKVYKALIRLASGALSVPLLMSMSLSFLTVKILLPHKSSEYSSLVPCPKAKSCFGDHKSDIVHSKLPPA